MGIERLEPTSEWVPVGPGWSCEFTYRLQVPVEAYAAKLGLGPIPDFWYGVDEKTWGEFERFDAFYEKHSTVLDAVQEKAQRSAAKSVLGWYRNAPVVWFQEVPVAVSTDFWKETYNWNEAAVFELTVKPAEPVQDVAG